MPISTILQEVDLQIYNSYDCANLHQFDVFYTNICAGVPNGGKGQCSGKNCHLIFQTLLLKHFHLQEIQVCAVESFCFQARVFCRFTMFYPIKYLIIGGPLLVNGVQVGIVSWSMKPCTIAPYPGVFTAVSSYIDWIQEQTGLTLTLNMFLRVSDD